MIPRPYFPSRAMRKPMVKWFSPDILLRTALQLVRSAIVGSQLDTRELQSLPEIEAEAARAAHEDANPNSGDNYDADASGAGERRAGSEARQYEFDGEEDFVFDFMADTGDGWDPTYSVASLLARDQLQVPDASGEGSKTTLRRGRFVVLGGDAVYPIPSDRAYRDRLVRPLRYAWDWCWETTVCARKGCDREFGDYAFPEPSPKIYVLPGNHDWYDSLSAFKNRFCNVSRPRRIGGWVTDQSRSYFALALPEQWYLFALDFGINSYSLDNLQYNYFSGVIDTLPSQARIILCAAEPDWVNGAVQNPALYRRYQSVERMISRRFEDSAEPAPRVMLNLSGDTHNYQRYERLTSDQVKDEVAELAQQDGLSEQQAADACTASLEQHYPRQKIVAGGGGAFLAPTHGFNAGRMRKVPTEHFKRGAEVDDKVAEVAVSDLYQLASCYPAPELSRWLALKAALLFAPRNVLLMGFIATLYLLLAWPMRGFLNSWISAPGIESFLDTGLNFMSLVISITLVVLFTLLVRSRPSLGLTIAGVLHGLAQVALLYGGYALVYFYVAKYIAPFLPLSEVTFPITRDIIYFVLIGGAATVLLGWALWLFLRLFGGAHDALFSSAAIPTHKHFLRIVIARGGRLSVYPIAIPKPVTYSQPAEDELHASTRARLARVNGEDWQRKPCHVAPDAPSRQSEPIDYHLIESPIVIDVPDSRAQG